MSHATSQWRLIREGDIVADRSGTLWRVTHLWHDEPTAAVAHLADHHETVLPLDAVRFVGRRASRRTPPRRGRAAR